jgi:hypothetical protein
VRRTAGESGELGGLVLEVQHDWVRLERQTVLHGSIRRRGGQMRADLRKRREKSEAATLSSRGHDAVGAAASRCPSCMWRKTRQSQPQPVCLCVSSAVNTACCNFPRVPRRMRFACAIQINLPHVESGRELAGSASLGKCRIAASVQALMSSNL